jgi:choline dehydrogenase-like flavoprotein
MKPRLSPRRSRAFDGREAMADSHQTALQKDTAMKVEKTSIDTLVVGAGQAGVAMSEHLSTLGVPHLVLERNRIAERWHTGRWDSLVANGPAWHDRFPNLEFDDLDLDAFASKEQIADYFVAYCQEVRRAYSHRCGSDEGRAQCWPAGLHHRNI